MRIPVPDVVLAPAELGAVHLVGIGGAGLSAIARLLSQSGVVVSGSDAKESTVLAELRAEGIDATVGHDAANLEGVSTVIVSTAVAEDNPEVLEARRRGLRIWPRSAGLMSAMLDGRRVAVAGTHGKTTTTAMLTCALIAAGADPTFAIGAPVASLGTNARRGSGPDIVVEADESDGAFLHYSPAGAIVTNVDADHLDTWGTAAAYDAAFEDFVRTTERFLVVSADDPGARSLVDLAHQRDLAVTTAGFAEDADVRGADLVVEGSTTTFTLVLPGDRRDTVRLAVPGQHYATDALLALAAGLRLGYELEPMLAGLASYSGAARRMEPKGSAAGVRVFDSYAHHPTEIAADLAAARSLAGEDRLVVVYQPHLVSRTREFGAQMGEALSAADLVVVPDLYLAREAPDPAVTSQVVIDAVRGPDALAGGPIAETPALVAGLLRPGDLLLTLGAGDVTTVGPAVLALLDTETR